MLQYLGYTYDLILHIRDVTVELFYVFILLIFRYLGSTYHVNVVTCF